MQLQHVPAPQGMLWVRHGFRSVFRQPIGFAALISTVVFGVLLLSRLPWIGLPLLLIAQPLVTLGFMLASKVTLEGGFPTPLLFAEPMRGGGSRPRSLLALGLAHAVLTFLMALVIGLLDSGALASTMEALPASMQAGPDAVTATLSTPGLLSDLLLRVALVAILAVPFWHAPALVHWDGQGWAQSMFSSTLGCWRNRAAFGVYLLGWLGVVIATSMVFALFSASPTLALVVGSITGLLLPTAFYASCYFTFTDCFGATEAPLAVVKAA